MSDEINSMGDVSNADRAWWALFALGDFVNRTGVDTARDAIADLITDLLHLARGRGLDTDRLLSNAANMMRVECIEGEEGDMKYVQAAFRRMLDSDD